MTAEHARTWTPGSAPVAVVMLTLNEAHNLREVLENLRGWAQEVFIVDSYSSDETIDIALEFGVQIVQRRFRDFGDQWNFALQSLPVRAPWTMKLDPDERLSDTLKRSIAQAVASGTSTGIVVSRRLWFMGKPLPVRQDILRVWKTGSARFSDVSVNEHPIVDGALARVAGDLEHYDSPSLAHWIDKQNRYTTAEALAAYSGAALADAPRLFGTTLQRRMWLKRNFRHFPLRYALLFLVHYLFYGAWRAGWVGFAWARLRSDVYRMNDYKLREMQLRAQPLPYRPTQPGAPDPRVAQC